jgi:hypothetical protein
MPLCMWAPCALRHAERGSWWQQQFCAGSNASAINIVMTELRDTLALCAPRPRARRARAVHARPHRPTALPSSARAGPRRLFPRAPIRAPHCLLAASPRHRPRLSPAASQPLRQRRILSPTYGQRVPPSFAIQVDEVARTARVQAGVPQRIFLDYLAAYKCARPAAEPRSCDWRGHST